MSERDPRWETIYGWTARPWPPADQKEFWKQSEEMFEMRLELVHEGVRWHTTQIFLKEDYDDLVADQKVFSWILDKMVEMMDEFLDGTRPNPYEVKQ